MFLYSNHNDYLTMHQARVLQYPLSMSKTLVDMYRERIDLNEDSSVEAVPRENSTSQQVRFIHAALSVQTECQRQEILDTWLFVLLNCLEDNAEDNWANSALILSIGYDELCIKHDITQLYHVTQSLLSSNDISCELKGLEGESTANRFSIDEVVWRSLTRLLYAFCHDDVVEMFDTHDVSDTIRAITQYDALTLISNHLKCLPDSNLFDILFEHNWVIISIMSTLRTEMLNNNTAMSQDVKNWLVEIPLGLADEYRFHALTMFMNDHFQIQEIEQYNLEYTEYIDELSPSVEQEKSEIRRCQSIIEENKKTIEEVTQEMNLLFQAMMAYEKEHQQ